MHFADAGRMVQSVWNELPDAYPDVAVDAFQVMPNHVHGIVVLGHRLDGDQSLSLGDVVSRFKTMTTTRYIAGVSQWKWPRFQDRLWQRDYFDHIIRGDRVLDTVRRYIAEPRQVGVGSRESEGPRNAGRPRGASVGRTRGSAPTES